jgi:hypothetical protein
MMTEVTFRKIPVDHKHAKVDQDDIEVCDVKLTAFTTGSYPAHDLTDDGETTYAQRYGVQYAAFKDGVPPEQQNDPVAAREAAEKANPIADTKPAPQTVKVPEAVAADPQPASKPVLVVPAPKVEPVA